MSITCGFFDSLNGDRKYNAEQLSSIFDGIITDGVFPNIGHVLRVKSTNSMMIAIDTGRAWFDHIWIKNDSEHFLTIDAPDLRFNRIDSIFLVVDHRESARNAYFTVVKGTPTLNPEIPSTIREYKLSYYRLANITVRANCEYISDGDISSRIGSYECPYIVGAVQTITNDEINSEWDRRLTIWFEQFSNNADDFMTTEQTNFITWFNGLQYILDGDVAGKLENQILKLEDDSSALRTDINLNSDHIDAISNTLDFMHDDMDAFKTNIDENRDAIQTIEESVQNLYSENLLVNLGNLKMAEASPKFDDLPIMPLGVHSQSNFTWNRSNGQLTADLTNTGYFAFINLYYSSKGYRSNYGALQIRMFVNGVEKTVDNLTDGSSIVVSRLPLVRLRVNFNKKYTTFPVIVDSSGLIAISLQWDGQDSFPDIKFLGFKFERGTKSTTFPEIDASAEILARVKDMMDGHSVVYHVGDVITLGNANQCWSGFITSDTTDIFFFIPFGKVIGEDVSSVSIEGKFQVRGANGYLNNNVAASSIWNFNGSDSMVKQISYAMSTNGVMVKVSFNTKPTGSVNNTPIIALSTETVKIRFI